MIKLFSETALKLSPVRGDVFLDFRLVEESQIHFAISGGVSQ